MKSLTLENEEKQLRLGLGQLLRYRQLLGAGDRSAVGAVLFVERRPSDPTWERLCEELCVELAWPESLDQVERWQRPFPGRGA